MDISIGLPSTVPGVEGERVIEWARRADKGPFRSLGLIDRLVFPGYEPLVTLSAAIGATQRIRVMPTVLLAPLRRPAMLAKMTATMDALSGGRVTLGLGVGAREDDFQADGVDFHRRGKLFDQQLETMHRIWSGEGVNGTGPIGPKPVQPGGPSIMLGGYSEPPIRRLARWGIGFISGGLPPEAAANLYRIAERVWSEAGRPGQPRIAGSAYFALGADGRERGGKYLTTYYGNERGGAIAANMPDTLEGIRGVIERFERAGAEELFLWPSTTDLDQVDQIADFLG